MNKIQIKAEILATLTALMTSTQPQASLITDLKNIDDKKTVLEVLIRELVNANEQKAVMICWLLMELIDKDTLNDELWNVIKAPEYNDHVKMIAFNMLKDLGNKIDYEVISGYFEQFNELINRETKQLLETAIMNPEAQIDFMDFLNAISDSDKIILIKSLEEDYAYDALANILIPVFLYYIDTEVGYTALEILGRSKSQLAYHALENAKKYVKLHPGMYKEILNDSTISAKNAVIIGEDGMKRIARNLCVRSDVALQTAEFALVEGKDAEFMEWCYVEAFASRTNAVNYLRAFFNSTDKEKCNKKLELIVGQYNCRKNSAWNNGNAGLPELAENIPEKNMLYVIQFLDGQFMEVLRKGVSEKSSLGWTGTFMKEGLALFLLYLHDGKELQQGSRSMLELTKHAFEFRLEEYKKGQNIKVEKTENEYFYELFLNWKDTTKIENSDRKKILDHIDNLMKKRVEAIMGANRRNYYGECAAYIAAIGEVKEKLGEKNAKQIYMSHYADMYTRRSAFKSELKSYGWIKR